MKNIQHIVYLMLENRSLDNVLGWLYENDTPLHFIPQNNTSAYNGLQPGFFNPDGQGGKVFVSEITTAQGQTIPSVDPNEEFNHVQIQIANNMQGFYIDFLSAGSSNPAEIMESFTPDSLPVINSLAKQFAVSDAYFSSIPTQTNCNRAFSLTGNSIGSYHDWPYNNERTAMVNNYWEMDVLKNAGDPYVFTENTIWNVLNNNGFSSENDWLVFYNQTWPGISPYNGSYCFTQDLLYPTMGSQTDHFRDFSQFLSMASEGTLPVFSYLEPTWYEQKTIFGTTIGHNGSDYHPPANVACGELFLYNLYEALMASPKWVNTLLIINFDEHGGTYDHVTPPANVMAPWANAQDGTAPPYDYDIPFSYTQLGVRVPLLLISPLIDEKTVISSDTSVPFDHTSVMATILNHFGIPKQQWGLGSRTANAPTFENVITLPPEKARTNVEIAGPLSNSCVSSIETPPSDLQWMIMHKMLARTVRQNSYSKSKFSELYKDHFSNIKTLAQLNEKAAAILQGLEAAGDYED